MPDGTSTSELNLPTDVAVLQGMIGELLASLHSDRKRIAHLEHQLDQLLKRLYGPRADRINPLQPSLFEEPAHDPPTTAPLEPVVVAKTVQSGHGRRTLPANLRRETVVVDIPEAKKHAVGGTWVKIGEEVSEKLDFTPSSLLCAARCGPSNVVRFENLPECHQI